jgi:ATP-dependent DNA ligase
MEITTFSYFYPEKPTLISKDQDLFKNIIKSGQYVAERKYNGMRLQLHYLNGKFQCWNRHHEDLSQTIKFCPEGALAGALAALPLKGYCLFDGELRQNKTKGIKQKMMLFDVFIWQNEMLLGVPFAERRQILADLIQVDGDPLGIPFQFEGDFEKVFNQVVVDEEIEGLVMKKKQGQFKISRKNPVDSTWMYKVRKANNKYRF